MQLDLFSEPVQLPALQLLEHGSSDYGPRTGVNARSADVTVAFAVDFTTAGEKLTHRLAGERYVGVPFGIEVEAAASRLTQFMKSQHGRTLNVAGNGIYTLSRHGITQDQANHWVHRVLQRVHAEVGLEHIRSGGQTGIDMAGLVAGLALGVPVTGLFPKGFRQRLANQRDVLRDAEDLKSELLQYTDAVSK